VRRIRAETAAQRASAALLPMLALGIPGSGTAAILLGGLMVWGLNPGPLLFVEHKDFVWGLITRVSRQCGRAGADADDGAVSHPSCGCLSRQGADDRGVLRDRRLCDQNAMFDIWLMLGFGVVGYVFKKIGIRWRRSRWRWCSATAPRTPSGCR
jgi:hypothetical protein